MFRVCSESPKANGFSSLTADRCPVSASKGHRMSGHVLSLPTLLAEVARTLVGPQRHDAVFGCDATGTVRLDPNGIRWRRETANTARARQVLPAQVPAA